MQQQIIFASHNAGKIRELKHFLQDLDIQIVPQADHNIPEPAETQLTFVENALLKARHAARLTGLAAIADDSGLVVPALHGAPGIYSARYAGEQATAEENIKKLLHALQNVPEKNRHAYFHCSLVYLAHAEDPSPLLCQGRWHGRILFSPTGTQGFGYDPIFFDPTQQCSAAELSLTIKNQLSHRGQALRCLMQALKEKETLC